VTPMRECLLVAQGFTRGFVQGLLDSPFAPKLGNASPTTRSADRWRLPMTDPLMAKPHSRYAMRYLALRLDSRARRRLRCRRKALLRCTLTVSLLRTIRQWQGPAKVKNR
jgi:hypothetical protein